MKHLLQNKKLKFILLAYLWVNLPEPLPRLRRIDFSLNEMKELLPRLFPAYSPPQGERDPLFQKKLALGEKFFFDKGFSRDQNISCSSCHIPSHEFTHPGGQAPGQEGVLTKRRVPSLVNVFAQKWFFWDGRSASLRAQALGPIEHPKEHGFHREGVFVRIKSEYSLEFENLYGPLPPLEPGEVVYRKAPPPLSLKIRSYTLASLGLSALYGTLSRSSEKGLSPADALSDLLTEDVVVSKSPDARLDWVFSRFGDALAVYESEIKALSSPFDRFAANLRTAKSEGEAFFEGFREEEYQGLKLFIGDAKCSLCHRGTFFTDGEFHNIGIEDEKDFTIDLGRALGAPLLARSGECKTELLSKGSPGCEEIAFTLIESLEFVGAFKTPSLRNVALRPPYGHHGRLASLDAVLEHYNTLSRKEVLGQREKTLTPLGLSEKEKSALKAFLVALSSPVDFFKTM